MLDHRGFSAWITSDDLELVEFEPRINDKTHTVTCWIAGPVGKTFIVNWRDHGSLVDSASYIHFDGFKVAGQFLYGRGEELRRGLRVGSEEERPFVFSAIEADDTFETNGKPADKNIGSIVLDIRLIKRVGEREPNPLRAPPNVVRGHRQQGDVCIRYGDVRPAAMRQRTYVMEPFDPKAPGPYVTFVFRYRSQDFLVSQGIINDDDTVARASSHPPVKMLSKADLPPLETSGEGSVLEPTSSTSRSPCSEQSPPPFSAASSVASRSPRSEQSPPPPFSAAQSVASRSPRNEQAPPPPSAATATVTGLALLGHGPRPQAPTSSSRVTSNSSNRSFSGTWDPAPTTTEYEDWGEYEYRPDDLNNAIANYY